MGCMGALSVTHERAFTELLTVDALRGIHSTGMASYNPTSKDIHIAKETGAPYELLRSADYTKSMQKVNRLLMGHNRYATKGKINKENAHPFKQSHIVGAHNGSLSFIGQQRLEDKDNKFDTDSEAIFWHISAHGFEDTWKYIANPVYEQNAFALTWFDTSQNKLFIVRNSKRPLFYAYSGKHDSIFWASEIGALQWIMYRNGLNQGESMIKTYSVNENTLYSWPIVKEEGVVSDPTMTKLKTPEPLYQPNVNYHSSNYNSTNFTGCGVPPFDLDKNKVVNLFPDEEKVAKFRQPYKNDNGTVLGKKAVEKITQAGCFYCGEKNFEWGKFAYLPTFGVSNTTEYLCKDCYLDPEIKQMVVDLSNAD